MKHFSITNYYLINEALNVFVVVCCTTIKLLLCHSLVRSVRYAAG